jgi:hypothetical protein
MEQLEAMQLQLRGQAQPTRVSLACAIVTFSPSAPPIAESVPIPTSFDPAPAAAVAG